MGFGDSVKPDSAKWGITVINVINTASMSAILIRGPKCQTAALYEN